MIPNFDHRIRTQARIYDTLQKNEAAMLKITSAPVVLTDEQAEKFGKGLRKIMSMGPDERKAFDNLDAEKLKQKYAGDTDIFTAIRAINESLQMVNDCFTGQVQQKHFANLFMKSTHQHLHQDNLLVTNIDTISTGVNAAGLDLGWQLAFQSIPVAGDRARVMDFQSAIQFLEYRDSDIEDINLTTMGSKDSDEFGPRYFATGIKYNDRTFRYTAFNVNQILSTIRIKAAATVGRAAYREILALKKGTTTMVGRSVDPSANFTYSGSDAVERRRHLIFQMRATLNEAYRIMIDEAAQVNGQKNKVKSKNAPLEGVNAQSPAIFYYWHGHQELINSLQTNLAGEDGINPTLYANITFVPTVQAPVCGGYNLTDNTPNRDDFGMFSSVKESHPNNTIGGMLVLPGYRNYHGIFRSLSFLSDSRVLSENEVLAAKMEHNFVIDTRQKFYVKLGETS